MLLGLGFLFRRAHARRVDLREKRFQSIIRKKVIDVEDIKRLDLVQRVRVSDYWSKLTHDARNQLLLEPDMRVRSKAWWAQSDFEKGHLS